MRRLRARRDREVECPLIKLIVGRSGITGWVLTCEALPTPSETRHLGKIKPFELFETTKYYGFLKPEDPGYVELPNFAKPEG